MSEKMLQQKAADVFARLAETYPNATIELTFSNPLELLVATVLSAQCTDRKVNEVTEHLFKKYRHPEDYVNVPAEELEKDIRPTGFYRQKAKSVRSTMQALLDNYNGRVPDDLEALVELPGIGRKTANIIVGNAFGKPAIGVDTHVKRVSGRIGLAEGKTPDKIEKELSDLYPQKDWTRVSHVLTFHGRYTCTSKNPACEECPVSDLCAYYQGT